MDLTRERISRRLGSRPFQFYESVDSTQDIGANWLKQGAQPGSVVIADEQRKGRGRLGRTWHTPPGVAIALSVILKPDVRALPQVMMLGALVISETLETVGAEDVRIKWPNDVLLKGKKVSGVLPEAQWQGNQFLGVVLGMGINVRVDFRGTDVEQTAISIESALHDLERDEFVVRVLGWTDYWSGFLGSDVLFQAWKSRLVTLGQRVTIDEITGIAQDVQADGSLSVLDDSGEVHHIIAGDII